MATKLGKIVADFSTSLATKISVGDTTATLQSATDKDSVALPTGKYFLTIDGETSQKEFLACTLTGTSLTEIKSITRQGVQSSGAVREHRVGASVSITNFAHIKYLNDLLDGTTNLDADTPLEYDATASITTANQLATKDYVDGVAIAGGADASTTVKGLSTLSAAPVSATAPIAVGDNDPRLPTSDEKAAMTAANTPATGNAFLVESDATSTPTASKIVQADGSGKIANGWLNDTIATNAEVDTAIGFNQYIVGTGEATTVKSFWNFTIPFVYSTNVPSGDFWTLTSPSGGADLFSNLGSISFDAASDSINGILTTKGIFSSGYGTQINFNTTKKIIVEFGRIVASIGSEQSGFGLTNSINGFVAYDRQNEDMVAFTVDTSGNLYAKTSIAGTGHTETAITGITLTNWNTFRIEFDPGVDAKFYVNGTLKATITTNLPVATTIIQFGSGASGNTGNNDGFVMTAPNFSIEK